MALSSYSQYDPTRKKPRLPREGAIDLTYRCNFQCRHCWVRVPDIPEHRAGELLLDEIMRIADTAHTLGCRTWEISGGEPMLRPDFPAIFDYLTCKASYSLNTNGALITPEIARMLTRPGYKMVALYGADAKVQDGITRRSGSFEATMQGLRYLKEAGAGFTVQIIPMRANYHQFAQMVELAKKLSPSWRIGAAWLYLTADRLAARNEEIKRQRLPARCVNIIDPAIPACGPPPSCRAEEMKTHSSGKYHLFEECVMGSQRFHVDPQGGMSFCSTIKDPAARFSLREFSFEHIWEKELPEYAERTVATQEYHENCGSCDLRPYCHWCGAYGYLENGRTSAPVPALCEIARERKRYDDRWRKHNRRAFTLGGLTLQVDSDLPFRKNGFAAKFKEFAIPEAGPDALTIRHHYSLPDPSLWAGGRLVYQKTPWLIYRKEGSWIYLGVGRKKKKLDIRVVVLFNDAHTKADVYHQTDRMVRQSRFDSLTSLPSDNIMIARVLAARHGLVMHSSGLILNGRGFLFTGQSGAGKSTVVKLLWDYGEVLCDDRIIVRKWPDGFHLHGTWSHGEIPQVANRQAPLQAILLLKKARSCKVERINDKKRIVRELLLRVSRPLLTTGWINQILDILNTLADEVPVYQLSFTRDIRTVQALEELTGPLHAAAAESILSRTAEESIRSSKQRPKASPTRALAGEPITP